MAKPVIREILKFTVGEIDIIIYDQHDGDVWMQCADQGGDYQDPFDMDQVLDEVRIQINWALDKVGL